MLYPRLQTVSTKGQVVLPADMRRIFGVRPGTLILIFPDLVNKKLVLDPLPYTDPIEAGYGMLKGGKSLTKALLEERRKDEKREEKKYAKLHL